MSADNIAGRDKSKGKAKPSSEKPVKKVVPDEELPRLPPPDGPMSGAPPWIVTFADLTTLMLTFFVLLLSFANMDVVKFQELMGSMSEAFGVSKDSKGSFQLMKDPGELAEALGSIKSKVDREKQERQMLVELVHDTARKSGMLNSTRIFFGEGGGLNVRLDSSVAFQSGSATLSKKIIPFIEGIAGIMEAFNFNLFIEGHTDNVPIRTKLFPSNWELSTVRATTILRKLIEFGVPDERLAAIGYADRKPMRENNTPENRAINRRVEFKFVKAGQ